ncbi:unnamed protein product [Schistocephalus solidus]|uniref:TPH domain-containing protein n=1 Tax=Schistocephalus solidus TaxID=70667 RepID=A0A183T3P2_SCHSO|nr:unnamed protein product [Schistocephalus solidus]
MTRERKQQEINARKRQIDEEIANYQKDLQEYQDKILEIARERALQKTAAEQQRLASERHQHELQRQANLEASMISIRAKSLIANQMPIHYIFFISSLSMAEEARRKSALEVSQHKEERALRAAEERDKMLQKTKDLASATEQLREEIRRAFKLDSFDKMAQQAQIINDLGLGNDI